MSYQLGKGIVPTLTYVVGSGASLKGDSVNIPYGWWIHRWLGTNAKGRYSVIGMSHAVRDDPYIISLDCNYQLREAIYYCMASLVTCCDPPKVCY